MFVPASFSVLFLIKSSLKRASVKPSTGSLFASLVLFFSPFFGRLCVTAAALAQLWTQEFLAKLPSGLHFSFPTRVFCLVENVSFVKLFEKSSFNLANALLAFIGFQDVDCSQSFCVSCFPFSFAESAVKRVEAFTVRGLERGMNKKLLPSESFLQLHLCWIAEVYFQYCDSVSAVPRYPD